MSEDNYYALFDKPTAQNLQANQRGRLTPEQQSALEVAVKSQRSTVVFFSLAITFVFAFMMFVFWKLGVENGLSTVKDLALSVGIVAAGLGLFAVYIIGDVSILFIGDEIKIGRVESVVGKVTWSGSRYYRVVSETRKLQSLRWGRTLTPPGDYRFYCLPHSGLVVAAEELGLVPAGQANDLLLDVLARTNHFSMEDLQFNREGLLSGHQEFRLLGFVFFWIVLLSAFIFVSFLALQNQLAGENMLIYILLILIAVYVFVRIGWRSISVLWDIWDGKIESVHGYVTRRIRRARNSRYYIYQLGDIKFNVSRSAYNALIEDKEYRIYFTPCAKRLVAIEPISD